MIGWSPKPRVKSCVPRIVIQVVPVKVEVVFQAVPEDNDRTSSRQPELAAESNEVILAKGTHHLLIWCPVRLTVSLRHDQ